MDGTLAAIFFIAGLTDMVMHDCPTQCLQRQDDTPALIFQASGVEFNRDMIGEELGVGYVARQRFGPFQPMLMATLTDADRFWIGAGARWTGSLTADDSLFIEATFMPGFDSGGHGPDIGGRLQFRSSLGVGYRFDDDTALALVYDHRSNGDRLAVNPGLETISLRLNWALD